MFTNDVAQPPVACSAVPRRCAPAASLVRLLRKLTRSSGRLMARLHPLTVLHFELVNLLTDLLNRMEKQWMLIFGVVDVAAVALYWRVSHFKIADSVLFERYRNCIAAAFCRYLRNGGGAQKLYFFCRRVRVLA